MEEVLEQMRRLTASKSEVLVLRFEGLSMRPMLRTLAEISLLVGMFGSGMANGMFLRDGGVVLNILRSSMADHDSPQEAGPIAPVFAGKISLLWVLDDPRLSFPRRGGIHSDTIVPFKRLFDVAHTALSVANSRRPDRVEVIHDARGDLAMAAISPECRFESNSSLATAVTSVRPLVFPCRAEYADAFVLSAHADRARITIDAFIADYITGSLLVDSGVERKTISFEALTYQGGIGQISECHPQARMRLFTFELAFEFLRSRDGIHGVSIQLSLLNQSVGSAELLSRTAPTDPVELRLSCAATD